MLISTEIEIMKKKIEKTNEEIKDLELPPVVPRLRNSRPLEKPIRTKSLSVKKLC